MLCRAYAAAGIVLVAALGMLAYFQRSVPAAAAPRSIAVVYFENLTDPADSEQLGRMMVTLLTSELAQAPDLAVTSSQRIYDIAHQLGGDKRVTIDRSVATAIAERAGVAAMLMGQIGQIGDRLLATAELIEVSSGRLLASQRAEGDSMDDIFTMAATLGRDLKLGLRGPGVAAKSAGGAGQMTDSVAALQAYLRGDMLLRRVELASAADQFREATRIDPEFAMAHYRLSLTSAWSRNQAEGLAAAATAVKLVASAPLEHRDMILASQLYLAGRFAEALPILVELVEAQPENAEALYLLSEVYVRSTRHSNLEQAARLLERILVFAPRFGMVYRELPILYVRLGQYDEARRVLGLAETEQPEAVQEVRALLLAVAGDPSEALRSSPPNASPLSQWYRVGYAMLASQWELALELASEDVGVGWPRALLTRSRGHVLALRGDFEGAANAYRAMARDDVVAPDGYIAALPLTRHHVLAELLALRGELDDAGAAVQQALAVQPEALRSLYLAGSYAARGGHSEAAAGYRDQLAEVIASSLTSSGWVYLDSLEAELALAGGNTAEARRLLENIVSSGHMSDGTTSYFSAVGPVVVDRLVQVYLALDQEQDAAEALQEMISGYPRSEYPVRYVRALYRLGVLAIERGQDAEGRQYLEQFLDHWGKADWQLPQVTDARARLGR